VNVKINSLVQNKVKIQYSKEELEAALKRKRELFDQPDHTSNIQLENIYHHKQSGRYIGDLVYGANDGIVTTFAVVSGAAGASLSPFVIIILGFANLLADGFSMASSSFLSRRSNQDYERAQRGKEAWEIEQLPEIEVQEVRDIFARMGFKGQDLDRATEITVADKKLWVDLMMVHELGIIEDPDDQPWRHGLATFAAFVASGTAPLIPFVIPALSENALLFSPIFAAVALFGSGALRTLITPKKWWIGGIEMLTVGSLAAFVAFVVGFLLQALIGATI